MVTASGIYQVTVNPANNPTYLSDGIYHVEVFGKANRREANFRAANGRSLTGKPVEWYMQPGTYERVVMLDIFESQDRVTCVPVEQPFIDALAQITTGILSWNKLTDSQQIEACKAGLR